MSPARAWIEAEPRDWSVASEPTPMAISAPTALVGGSLAALAGGLLCGPLAAFSGEGTVFFAIWIGVFLLTAAFNTTLLHREARRRGVSLFSPANNAAFFAILPSLIVGAGAALAGWWLTHPAHLQCGTNWMFRGLPQLWAVLYGMGLLATQRGPRAVRVLGWSFLSFGLVSLVGTLIAFPLFRAWSPVFLDWAGRLAHALMAVAFGGFHLFYAACAWPRSRRKRVAESPSARSSDARRSFDGWSYIYAPAAMTAGIASTVFGIALFAQWRPLPVAAVPQFTQTFILGWPAVLLLALVAAGAAARVAQRKFGSGVVVPGLKDAAQVLVIVLGVTTLLTVQMHTTKATFLLSPVWMWSNAIALLAGKHFVARRIAPLGWLFLFLGFATACLILLEALYGGWTGEDHIPTIANVVMVPTFGLIHMVYAAYLWPGNSKGDEE